MKTRSCELPVDAAAHRGGAAAVRSVVATTPGVVRARLRSSSHAVRVEYDPGRLTVAALLRAVPGLVRPGPAPVRRTVRRLAAR